MNSHSNKKHIVTALVIMMTLSFWAFAFAQLYVPNTSNINRILVQQKREQMKEDLSSKINLITDSQKRYLANKITNEMDNANEVWVNHFYDVLTDLDNILVKIKSRSQKAASNGKDISSVESAIKKAEDSLRVAKSVVDEQAEHVYIIDAKVITKTVSSDQNLLLNTFRNQFILLNGKLQNDIPSIRDGVMRDAKNDVREAFLTLADIPNVDDKPADFMGK